MYVKAENEMLYHETVRDNFADRNRILSKREGCEEIVIFSYTVLRGDFVIFDGVFKDLLDQVDYAYVVGP